MVLYSNESLVRRRVDVDAAGMEQLIEVEMSHANQAFNNSNIDLRLNIVSMQLVSDAPYVRYWYERTSAFA